MARWQDHDEGSKCHRTDLEADERPLIPAGLSGENHDTEAKCEIKNCRHEARYNAANPRVSSKFERCVAVPNTNKQCQTDGYDHVSFVEFCVVSLLRAVPPNLSVSCQWIPGLSGEFDA
jgi:hypothetical protein